MDLERRTRITVSRTVDSGGDALPTSRAMSA